MAVDFSQGRRAVVVILEALGIDLANVRSVTVHASVDAATTVTVTRLAAAREVGDLASLLRNSEGVVVREEYDHGELRPTNKTE